MCSRDFLGMDWDRSIQERLGNPITQYGLLALVTAGVFAALAALLNPSTQIENVRTVLTTVALAEASVLAIVFSVTVVALQLVVNRYSARLTSLFIKDPMFRTTFALFVGAIGLNLLFVYLLPAQVGRLTHAAVGIAFALAVVSTLALYQFIRLMIHRSSPDELISVLVDRELAPTAYLPATVEEFSKIEVHPIRPLYRTVARAIELGEYQTAVQGIEGLRTVLTRTYEYLENELSEEDAAQFASAVSEEVLTEYVPPILEQAFAHEQYELATGGIEEIKDVALEGLNRGFYSVIEDAAEGLGDAFDSAPLTWEGNRLRSPIKDALIELTKAAATKADYPTYLSVSHHLNQQMTVLLRRRPDSDVTRRIVREYYSREAIDIFDILLYRYAPDLSDEDVNWISPTEGSKSTLPDEAEPLRDFWRRYVDFTQTVLHYRLSEGEYPFVEGSIDDGWKRAMESAADAGLDGLATLFCISTIQLAYCNNRLEDGRLGMWTNHLALLKKDYNPEIVDQAFEHLKAGNQPEGRNISIPRDTHASGGDDGFIARYLANNEQDLSFEKWLINFEQGVHERSEYLQEE